MKERVITDRAGDVWTVEQAGRTGEGLSLLHYRHELGYEVLVAAPKALAEMEDRSVVAALEEARRRSPRSALSEAA